MRDIVITLLVMGAMCYTFVRPHYGILLWSWLGYMNPHRLCYGFAYSLPFSQLTAILTMAVLLFSKERKTLPNHPTVYLLIIMILWMGFSTLSAFSPEAAQEQFIKIIKIQLPIFITLMIFNTKQRINELIWVIFISLGYFSIKGGVFTLMTAGSFRVWGPPGSFIEENNSLAIATLMVIPLAVYLRTQINNNLLKKLMLLGIISMSISVIGSQSRGAFLSISVVGFYYWLQSDNKFVTGFVAIVFIAIVAMFLPDSWYDRMNSIGTYEQDESAMGRIHAWTVAYNVANDKIFGGGLNLWNKATYIQYLEGYDPKQKAYVAHSIYFSILGEHGWIGLFLFLLLFYMTWNTCSRLAIQCRDREDIKWISDLSKMIKVGLLAYLSGGAFLSLSYFDLPWHMVSIVILLHEIKKNTPEKADDVLKSEEAFEIKPVEDKKVRINDNGYIQ